MNEIEILAKTLWGEARGEPLEGKVAVANVIVNRARIGGWWGDTVNEVCLKPWQFSCWNTGNPNRAKLDAMDADDTRLHDCTLVAELALLGALADLTGGATHYHADNIKRPYWADEMSITSHIGNHLFYKENEE